MPTLLTQLIAPTLGQRHAAFTEIVAQNLPLLYAAARRQVPDPSLADDITQAAFLVLLQKAPTLPPDTLLPAWLLTVTHNICKDARKRAARRLKHEPKAAAMTQTTPPPATDFSAITPHLDAALATLTPTDRAAVILRYLQQKPFADISLALHLTEPAAKKRIQRALHKLRRFFARHHLTLSAATLPHALLWHTHTAPSVPATLAAQITAASFTTKTALSATTLSLTKGALHTMFWTHLKIAALASAAALALVAVTTLAAQHNSAPPLPTPGPAFIAHVPGADLELVAVGAGVGPDSSSWRADGTPLADDNLPWTGWNGDKRTVRHIRLRIDSSTTDLPDLKILTPNISWFPATSETDTSFHSDLLLHAAPDQHTLDFRALLATSPWKTRLTFTTPGAATFIDDPNGTHSLLASASLKVGHDTLVILSDAHGNQDYRLTATDRDGTLHTAKISAEGTDDLVQILATFPNLDPARITQLHYDTRPYDQFIDFKNIALDPATPTHVQILTTQPTTRPN